MPTSITENNVRGKTFVVGGLTHAAKPGGGLRSVIASIDTEFDAGLGRNVYSGKDSQGEEIFRADTLDPSGDPAFTEDSQEVEPPTEKNLVFVDDFEQLRDNYTLYFGNDAAGPLTTDEIETSVFNGRLKVHLKQNINNRLLWFQTRQGFARGRLVAGDFEAIAYNIGVESGLDTQTQPRRTGNPVLFGGPSIHSSNQDITDFSHLMCGHLGSEAQGCIERKNNRADGTANVSNTGTDSAPDCRADIRVIRDGANLIWFWRLPGAVNWTQVSLPGVQFTLTPSLYINLIFYAQNQLGLPCFGTCDNFEIYQ